MWVGIGGRPRSPWVWLHVSCGTSSPQTKRQDSIWAFQRAIDVDEQSLAHPCQSHRLEHKYRRGKEKSALCNVNKGKCSPAGCAGRTWFVSHERPGKRPAALDQDVFCQMDGGSGHCVGMRIHDGWKMSKELLLLCLPERCVVPQTATPPIPFVCQFMTQAPIPRIHRARLFVKSIHAPPLPVTCVMFVATTDSRGKLDSFQREMKSSRLTAPSQPRQSRFGEHRAIDLLYPPQMRLRPWNSCLPCKMRQLSNTAGQSAYDASLAGCWRPTQHAARLEQKLVLILQPVDDGVPFARRVVPPFDVDAEGERASVFLVPANP